MENKKYMQFIEAYYIDDKIKNIIPTKDEPRDFAKEREKSRERDEYVFVRNKYDPDEFMPDSSIDFPDYRLRDYKLDKAITDTPISDDIMEKGSQLDKWIGKFLNLLYNDKEKRLYVAHLFRTNNDENIHTAYNILHNIEDWLKTPLGKQHANAVVSGLPQSVSSSIAMALSDKTNPLYVKRHEFPILRNLYMLSNESVLQYVHSTNTLLEYFGIDKSPYLY